MKTGDLRRFKGEAGLADGKTFLVVDDYRHEVSAGRPPHNVTFLLDGKLWNLSHSWVESNSEALDEIS